MPSSTQNVLITWIPNSIDGAREATKLYRLYKNYAELRPPERLGDMGEFMSVILVGHRSELLCDYIIQSMLKVFSGKQNLSRTGACGCNWLVLAICEGGVGKYHGALSDNNEILSPARRLADLLKIKVSSTVRPLLFDEVGQGKAFTLACGGLLIRSNPDHNPLWYDFEPNKISIDELANQFSRL
ncbi:hypothetical protein [Microbulbifer thermotolerans]|uniref:hypothetical protein n=1 Tax=Microbulbifer thermotolerans TaxID=252514 RepID=UPI00224B3CC1|nr:hypothetical protein [Microbulbifer thermotolerans]MCX2778862.1 hypothetical protein [Microbulbifer thermotolerans]MCX2804167.1 hypothetical protein [Microbulbifer thermotolerans]